MILNFIRDLGVVLAVLFVLRAFSTMAGCLRPPEPAPLVHPIRRQLALEESRHESCLRLCRIRVRVGTRYPNQDIEKRCEDRVCQNAW